jgi:hypothetical protein
MDSSTELPVKIAQHDCENSHPLDLTDEAMLAQSESHKVDGTEEMALQGSHEKK